VRSSASPCVGIHNVIVLRMDGKRTDVDAYRLQSRGGKGVINMKANSKVGKVVSIQLVDDTTEMMVISQFGKIIRIDTKSVRAAGRSTSGVKPSIRLTSLRVADEAAAPSPPNLRKAVVPFPGPILLSAMLARTRHHPTRFRFSTRVRARSRW
jgi:DNA gyrase C-terminal domain, beta-propeller